MLLNAGPLSLLRDIPESSSLFMSWLSSRTRLACEFDPPAASEAPSLLNLLFAATLRAFWLSCSRRDTNET